MPKPSPSERARKAGGRTKRKPVAVASYNQLIAGLELQQIRLVTAELHAPHPPERRATTPVLHLADASYRNGEGEFTAQQTLVFSGTYEGETDAAVRVRVTFEVRYASAERMSDEIFAEFRARNLPVNTWPYFREFVQSSLARMGWPVLTLPAFKAAPKRMAPIDDEASADAADRAETSGSADAEFPGPPEA
jgi:hypothetical protein